MWCSCLRNSVWFTKPILLSNYRIFFFHFCMHLCIWGILWWFFFYFLLTTTINRKFVIEWLFLRKIVKIIHCLTKKTHRTCWLIQINSLGIFQGFFKEKGDFLERGGITLIPFWSGVLPKNKEFRISIQLTITFYEVILIWLSEDQVLWYWYVCSSFFHLSSCFRQIIVTTSS